MRRPFLFLPLLACLGVLTTLTSSKADQVVTLEGDLLEGEIKEITRDQQLVFGDHEPRPLNQLRAIVPANQREDVPAAPYTVWLTNGSRFSTSAIKLGDEIYQLQNPVLGSLEIPIDLVWAVRLGQPDFESRFARAVREMILLEEDIFYITGTGTTELQEVTGLIEALDQWELSFDQEGELKRLPADQVHGVILASPFFEPEIAPWTFSRLTLSDGSVISGNVARLHEGQAVIQLGLELEITLPWDQVRRMTIDSDLLHYLSDLDPIESTTEAIYAFPRNWKRDANVRGAALRLGQDRYEKGLGVGAGTRITFVNDADYTLFTATIGLDAARGIYGDCEFVVLSGNRELFRQQVSGGDPSRFIRLEVENLEEITLSVEPRIAGLDLGDDANWCEACFVTD